jgi:hypothetical protein
MVDSTDVIKKQVNVFWLIGTIANFGHAPLLTSYFKCYLTNKDGDTLKTYPKFLDLFPRTNLKDIFPAWKNEIAVDLLRPRTLESQNFVTGFMICTIDSPYKYHDIIEKFLNKSTTHIICIDQEGKEYSSLFKDGLYAPN